MGVASETQMLRAHKSLGLLLLAAVSLLAQSASASQVTVGLPLNGTAALEERFWAISSPNNPSYLQHLSVEQLRDLIGASEEQVKATVKWLESQGATNIRVSPTMDVVTAELHQDITLAQPQPFRFDFVLRQSQSSFQGSASRPVRGLSAEAPMSAYTIGAQKDAYGIPTSLCATNDKTTQMVWGPGTFGYSKQTLESLKSEQVPLLNMDKVLFDTQNHGRQGGDNFGEGDLDTSMISSFGLNATTIVSNTNVSSSTEEGKGFGDALLIFLTDLASRKELPQVLSLSLGSLSPASCDLLCTEAVKKGVSAEKCNEFLQSQRQVCMFEDQQQVARINTALMALGARGVTVFGSSGDGGSHYSFQKYEGGSVADVLNQVSCEFQMPVFPTTSPYIISVGGTEWKGLFSKDPKRPIAWPGSGGGFDIQFGAPDYQKDTVSKYLSSTSGLPPASSFNASGKAYPDLSAVGIEGTSQSSPSMAGIWTLIMDARLNNGLPPLGFIGPRLWKVNEDHPGEAFEDITSGNTKDTCSGAPCDNGFPATVGWDPVVGWGRPVWAGMVKHFGSDQTI